MTVGGGSPTVADCRPVASLTLLQAPVFPSILAWSEHDQLALALDHVVHVLDATRVHECAATFDPTETVERAPDGAAAKAEEMLSTSAHAQLHSIAAAASTYVRAVCWSPAGVCAHGGCALLAVTHSGRAEVAAPPCSPWVERMASAAELSGLLERRAHARVSTRARDGARARTRRDDEFVTCGAWDPYAYPTAARRAGGPAGEAGETGEARACSLIALGAKSGLRVLVCRHATAGIRARARLAKSTGCLLYTSPSPRD